MRLSSLNDKAQRRGLSSSAGAPGWAAPTAEFDSAKLGHEGRNSFVNENTLDILLRRVEKATNVELLPFLEYANQVDVSPLALTASVRNLANH